jgi:hypothetical protein
MLSQFDNRDRSDEKSIDLAMGHATLVCKPCNKLIINFDFTPALSCDLI